MRARSTLLDKRTPHDFFDDNGWFTSGGGIAAERRGVMAGVVHRSKLVDWDHEGELPGVVGDLAHGAVSQCLHLSGLEP